METDDNGHTHGGGSGSATGSGAGTGYGQSTSDPVRDLLLAFAAQIDAVAGWFGTADRGTASSAAGAGQTSAAGTFLRDGPGVEMVGEITGLIREIGDLVARLIAALITVLEAIAAALRTVPAQPGTQPRRYQPIAVRLDAAPSSTTFPTTTTAPRTDRPTSDHQPTESEK